jgi:quercetin dioxygenase-like cupin family protein
MNPELDVRDLPRVVGSTGGEPGAAGAVWKLSLTPRDLDANVIQLPAGDGIDAHTGPDIDVMLVVLDGTGRLTTERTVVDLEAGAIVWLPRRSRREFRAGPQGLRYLTVHQRRQALVISGPPPRQP